LSDIIRASGLYPRQQAGHMTAADHEDQNVKISLAKRGRPHLKATKNPPGSRRTGSFS
jgi:hypothetical protein